MKTGDRVRVVQIPPGLPDDEELRTRALFEKCVGRMFTIVEVKNFDSSPYQLLQLDVGRVVGKRSYMETIWIEPEYVEQVP